MEFWGTRRLQARRDRLEAWLLGARAELPDAAALSLRNGLFTSVPIFLGGIVNTIAIAAIALARHDAPAFQAWFGFECLLGVIRLAMLLRGRRALKAGREPPRLAVALLSCAWAASLGLGTFLCLTSGDWVLATIASLSAAAMVCGICLRNFGTPRLAVVMVAAALVPCTLAGLMADQPILRVISIQLPIFMATIASAAFALHRIVVLWMGAVSELERSQVLNQTILQSSPDSTMILDVEGRVAFYNQPRLPIPGREALLGELWLDLLPVQERAMAAATLDAVRGGEAGHLVTHGCFPVLDAARVGSELWYDVIINRIADGSGRLMIVARDITRQKETERRAVWTAQHDVLTGLPNRALLQQRLDALLAGAAPAALLIVDIDNFKSINDTLGHDGGDAFLCHFAGRLREAVGEGGMVARTGGDEFTVILGDVAGTTPADAEQAAASVAERIFAALREPFAHESRQLDCGASIGASLIPRDGQTRSQAMKSADVALYAAKSAGRAQWRLFEPAMMIAVERHQAMIAAARFALRHDTIEPHYQPKVSLIDGRITGFEALLRWRDQDGMLRGPDALHAAFEDRLLGGPLADRMLDRILTDVQRWLRSGVDFGHVAINVAASDFRRRDFAEALLERLRALAVPPARIQIDVTETVFLEQGGDGVEAALLRLSAAGIRIALDDFGTGYASLSHLKQFPVDVLKIDRSFVDRIGNSPDAAAISAAVINLGHCLGLEVVAEGIETEAQARQLARMGCDTGQGYLYAKAMTANAVVETLDDRLVRVAARA
jgi:diguanylate cyclase (GGDEF)-like protein/PAS domain S-box-containing protein